MIRILYCVPQRFMKHPGLNRKIRNLQIIFNQLGADFHVFEKKGVSFISDLLLTPPANVLSYDVIITRGILYSRKWRNISKLVPIIVERHVKRYQFESMRDLLRLFWESLYCDPINFACLVICPVVEIQDSYRDDSDKFKILNNPTTFLRKSLLEFIDAPKDKRIVGISIGIDKSWQGIVQFINLAQRLPRFTFRVLSPVDLKYVNTPSNIEFVKIENDQEYLSELSSWMCGVSSLSLNNKKMNIASPLKNRDIIGLNIPLILAHNDEPISNWKNDYILQISDMESSWNLIDSFLEKIYSMKEAPVYSRELQEKISLEFFSQELYGLINSSLKEFQEKTYSYHQVQKISTFEKLLRKMFSILRRVTSENVYYAASSTLKKLASIRARNQKVFFSGEFSNFSKTENRPMSEIVITHDIDSIACVETIEDIVLLEQKYNLRSTINVLTKGDYKLDPILLKNFESKGFEIGLHGDFHDVALGYRNILDLEIRIKEALHDLSTLRIKSFRAPGLSHSFELMQVLAKNRITHDSSIIHGLSYGKKFMKPFDIHLPLNQNIREVPLTLGDDVLFKNHTLDTNQILHILMELVRKSSLLKIPCVVNFHPRYFNHNLRFLEQFFHDLHEKYQVRSSIISEN